MILPPLMPIIAAKFSLLSLSAFILFILRSSAIDLNGTVHTTTPSVKVPSAINQRSSCPPQLTKAPLLKRSLPTELIRAAYAGDLVKLKSLVTRENILLRDSMNNTLAHLAAEVGNVEMLRFLISKEKALVEAEGLQGGSPLYAATVHGHERVVKFLLDKNGANANTRVNTRLKNGSELANYSALHMAADHGFLDIAKMLLLHGANISCRDGFGNTPLHAAAVMGQLEMVKYLVELRNGTGTQRANLASLEARANSGDMPIHFAATNKKTDIVWYLARVDPRQLDAHGRFEQTVLHIAAGIDDDATLREALKYQPDLEAVGNYANDTAAAKPSVTALMFAAANGHRRIVQILLDAGANDSAVDWRGNSAVHLATMGGHSGVVEELLERKPLSVNLTGEKSYTPLHFAIEKQEFELVRLLLKYKANLSARATYWDDPKTGWGKNVTESREIDTKIFGPLCRVPPLRRTLVAHDPIRPTPSATPLLFAARVGNLRIFRALLESGARVDQPDTHSRRFPIHLAALNGHVDIVEQLLRLDQCQLEWRGGHLDETPLAAAIRGNQTLAAQYLLRMGADVEAKSRHGEDLPGDDASASPLHLAVQQTNCKLVEMILRSGADPNSADRTGRTPLHEAVLWNNNISAPVASRLIDLLIRHGAVGGVEDVKGQTSTDYAFEDDLDGENFRLLVRSEPQPLHRAVAKGTAVFIRKAILHLPSRLHHRNRQGETSLEMAVRLGKVDVAAAMVEAGLRVDTVNANGDTLLHIATSHSNTTIRSHLVEMIVRDAGVEVLQTLITRSNNTGLRMIDIARLGRTVRKQLHK